MTSKVEADTGTPRRTEGIPGEVLANLPRLGMKQYCSQKVEAKDERPCDAHQLANHKSG